MRHISELPMYNEIRHALRFCSDIGLHALDRPASSCSHASAFCKAHCYNLKLYRVFGHVMRPKDTSNESAWRNIDVATLRAILANLRGGMPKRIRLMTRGEALSTMDDKQRIIDICKALPKTLVWIPTRAWRSGIAWLDAMQDIRKQCKNVRIMCSIDPSNFSNEHDKALLAHALQSGFSTMFFGDDAQRQFAIAGKTYAHTLCSKTHKHKLGACATCRNACFSPEQRHIHLLSH